VREIGEEVSMRESCMAYSETVRYSSCWRWDWLSDDQGIGDSFILANLIEGQSKA